MESGEIDQPTSSEHAKKDLNAVDSTAIPAGHTTNLPVTMALSTLRQTSGNWAVQQRSLGTGILAARTLMRDDGRRSAIQVMNVSEEDFVLRRGEFIGEAEQVTAADNEGGSLETVGRRGDLLGGGGGSYREAGRGT